MSKAGRFEVLVSPTPYPVWCELIHNGEVLALFTHKELSDLKYAAEKAMQEARTVLSEDDRYEV